MIELEPTNKSDLLVGQEYYVINRYDRTRFRLNLLYLGNSYFRDTDSNLKFKIHSQFFHFYRFVSREEYYMKLKEKYDATCLNLILKRLVNDELFGW